jgi:hypothetical protein
MYKAVTIQGITNKRGIVFFVITVLSMSRFLKAPLAKMKKMIVKKPKRNSPGSGR